MNLRPNERREETDVNLTPLIDVVFLLLIFFMVSTSFKHETAVSVDLPKSGQAPAEAEPPGLVELVIDAEGNYYLGKERLPNTEVGTIETALEQVLGDDRDQPLVIRADGRTPHQAVITAMEAARRLGINRLSFTTLRVPHEADSPAPGQ